MFRPSLRSNGILRHYHDGFTLVELVLATALVMTLVALLFPTMQATRQKTKAMECANVLRDIGVAAALYSNDNDGYFFRMRAQPPVGPVDSSKNPWSYPGGLLDRYLNGGLPGKLPVNRLHRGCPLNREQTNASGSYAANRRVIIGDGAAARKRGSLPAPANTLLVVEAGKNLWMNDGFEAESTFYNLVGEHHQGRMNILWADGHITTQPRGDLANSARTAFDPRWLSGE